MVFNRRMQLSFLVIPALLFILMLLPDDMLTVGESLAFGFGVIPFGFGLILGQWTLFKNPKTVK